MPIHTSPFPTTHDTIGASALDIPPSSPPSVTRRSTDQNNVRSLSNGNHGSPRIAASNEAAITDFDKRLSEYTVDFNKFPGGGNGEVQESDEEKYDQPEFGGPEDFTFNLDKYLDGSASLQDQQQKLADKLDAEEIEEREGRNEHDLPDSPSPSPRHRRHHHEEAEESEFGPPVDMSTPSHLMWRKNANSGRGEETRLEDIEESLPSSPEKAASPSKDGKDGGLGESRTFTTVLREIEDLHEQRRERDEKIRLHEKRLTSNREEIEYLREELQRKSSLLEEANAKIEEKAVLQEQLELLKAQSEKLVSSEENDAKEEELQRLRKELQDARDQLAKRDEALAESSRKLSELNASNELQLREKSDKIEDLIAEIAEKELEIGDADEELAESQRQYDALKDRILSLEMRNSPLEEKNAFLEKELNSVKVELVSQKNVMSAMAAELSVEVDGKEYNDIINSMRQLFKEGRKSDQDNSTEIEDMKTKLDRVQALLQQHIADKQLAETEWKRTQDLLSESRGLIATIEGENTRLTARIQELNMTLTKARDEISFLEEEQQQEQQQRRRRQRRQLSEPEPPTISFQQAPTQIDVTALHEAHRVEIKNLREAHMGATKDLHTSYSDTIQHLRTMLSTTEKRENELHNQLLSTKSTTTAQVHEISSLTTQIQQLQSSLALKEETCADMDKLIARSVEKREREWERRTDLLLKEREKMGKALMQAWGEKEVGKMSSASSASSAKKGDNLDGVPTVTSAAHNEKNRQGYRYKYVVRS